MNGFLRFVAVLNAAIWLGATLFFVVGVLLGVFSQDMRNVFGPAAYPYYSGAVAMVLFHRFFAWQYFCGTVAILQMLAEKFYTGRSLPRVGAWVLGVTFGLVLLGGLWLLPHMESWRHAMIGAPTPEQKESARRSFWMWHGLSQFANIFILAGLLGNLFRVTKPAVSTRQSGYYQIP